MTSVRSGTITFGLVAIPVRVYVATHSAQLTFHLLHQGCGARVRHHASGARIRQQTYCPQCARVVERRDLVKGYEFAKDRYVTFTEAELAALAAAASPTIEIRAFVPLAAVDPLYFATGHYLGPDRGGERAYQLLAAAMRDRGRVAVAQATSHGKEQLALLRPRERGFVLHTLYYAHEVRPFDAIAPGSELRLQDRELRLAGQLIDQLSVDTVHLEAFEDVYRRRVEGLVQQKIAGEAVTIAEPARCTAPILELTAALEASLARRGPRTARRRPLAALDPRGAARRPERRTHRRRA